MKQVRIVFAVCIGVAILVVLVVAVSRYAPKPRASCEGCNVILISIDTFGAKHSSVYTPELDTTPYLKQLAAESGVVFEQAYSQAPWTLPSHAAMFTGRYPWDMGIMEAGDALPLSATTIAESLLTKGYATAAYSNGPFVNPLWQMTQGFESFTGSLLERDWNDLPSLFNQGATYINEHAKTQKEKSFFLLLRPFMVHDPYGPLEEAGTVNIHDIVRANALPQNVETLEAKRFRAAYHNEIRLTDTALKEFVENLRQAGLLENTILIITSDHGEEFGEHGTVGAHSVTLHRENLWVPLIIIAPGVKPARIPATVEIRSIPDTIAELTGADRSTFEGRSLVPLMLGKETDNRIAVSQTALTREVFLERIEYFYTEGAFGTPKERGVALPRFSQSIVEGQWHLIRNASDSGIELYDTQADINERIDLFPRLEIFTPEIQVRLRYLVSLFLVT